MDKGFEFNVTFNKELDEPQRNEIRGRFINFIEEYKVSWGGGDDTNYITGYLDCTSSNLDLPELIKKLFEHFLSLNILKTIEIIYPMSEEV